MPRNRRIVIDQQTSDSMLRDLLHERRNNHLNLKRGGVGCVFITSSEFVILMAITGRSGREGANHLASQIMDLTDKSGELTAVGLHLEFDGRLKASSGDGSFDYTLKYAVTERFYVVD